MGICERADDRTSADDRGEYLFDRYGLDSACGERHNVDRFGKGYTPRGIHCLQVLLFECVDEVQQAEYLPLPTVTVLLGDNTSEMVTNLLTSVLPQMPGAKTLAVTVSDFEWAEVIFYEKEEGENGEKKQEAEDDIWVSGEDEETEYRPGDWVGVERDRRSAYLIIGALRSEGII